MLSLPLLVVLFEMSCAFVVPDADHCRGHPLGFPGLRTSPKNLDRCPIVCKESTATGVFGLEFQGTDDKLFVFSCFPVAGLSLRQPGCRSLGKVCFMFSVMWLMQHELGGPLLEF